jgi:hypothetical protein
MKPSGLKHGHIGDFSLKVRPKLIDIQRRNGNAAQIPSAR